MYKIPLVSHSDFLNIIVSDLLFCLISVHSSGTNIVIQVTSK